MQIPNLFLLYTDILKKNDIQYFISGSVASIVYGEPRLTNDIDLIIALNESDIKRFIAAFSSNVFYCPPEETISSEVKLEVQGHFNLIHQETGFKADIYLIGKDEFQIWALKNKVKINFEGSEIYLAPVEYVVIKKLEWYKEGKSPKHLSDIQNILSNSESLINFSFLGEKIREFELESVWELVKQQE